MTDLPSLRRRVLEASGPDRDLDRDLYRSLIDDGDGITAIYERWNCPAYTASIDAVFALADAVLPGSQLFPSNVGYAHVVRVDGEFRGRRFDAANRTERRPTPALALLAALLEALSMEAEDGR